MLKIVGNSNNLLKHRNYFLNSPMSVSKKTIVLKYYYPGSRFGCAHLSIGNFPSDLKVCWAVNTHDNLLCGTFRKFRMQLTTFCIPRYQRIK